jgi:hypothetical protein
MPRTRRAPGKRSRVQASAKTPRKIAHRALDMEVPLNDAMEFVQALRMIGDGMVADDNDDGRPIAAVARAALNRLDDLKRAWVGVIKLGRRPAAAR